MSKRAEQMAMGAHPDKIFRYKKIGDADGVMTGESVESQQYIRDYFIEGYQQAEKDFGWHSVKESLPPIDEEVIVLTNDVHGTTVPGAQVICFGHRPNPDGWDGKNIDTGEVTHYVTKTYEGWNIPGVTHWMYCPKLEDEL